MLCWLPLGVFGVPWACFGTTLDSFWLPLGRPWAPFRRPGALVGTLVCGSGAFGSLCLPLGAFIGCPWAPFVSLWDTFGALCLPLGCLWLPVAVLWAPFGLPWHPLGQLLDFLENEIHFCEQMCQNHCKTQQDIAFWNLPPEAAEAPEAPEAAEVVSASATQIPPSTRAGGQDDGSTQTPSN